MTATANPRALTVEFSPDPIASGIPWGVEDNSVGVKGTIGVINLSTGYLKMGVTGTGLVCAGRIDTGWDNTSAGPLGAGHAAGAIQVAVRQGVFPWYMGTAGDAITNANVGALCYIIDNQTVGLTDGGGTRSIAGIIQFLAPAPAVAAYQQVYVQMGAYVGVFGSGTVAGSALTISGVQSNTGAKTFADSTFIQNNSAGTFHSTLHSNATANSDVYLPNLATATLAALEGTQTWIGVKSWATTSDPLFAKEGNHNLIVVATTTAATAGGALTIAAGMGATSGTGGALAANGGAGDTTGTGGAAALTGGAGGSASGTGGAASIVGGVGTAGNAVGGAALATGGAGNGSGAGGAFSAAGGLAGATGVGGAASVTAGAGGATSGAGGASSLVGGAATASNSAGGAVAATGGAGSGSSAGGAATVTGGVGGATGAGGAVTVSGGAGGGTSGTGGAMLIKAGAGSAGNASGGNTTIRAGLKNGSGANGNVVIGDSATAALQLGIGNAITDPGNAGAIAVTFSGACMITSGGAETRTVAIPAFIGETLTLCMDTYAGAVAVTFASAINVAGNTVWTTSAVDQNISLIGCSKAGTKCWRVIAKDGGTLS